MVVEFDAIAGNDGDDQQYDACAEYPADCRSDRWDGGTAKEDAHEPACAVASGVTTVFLLEGSSATPTMAFLSPIKGDEYQDKARWIGQGDGCNPGLDAGSGAGSCCLREPPVDGGPQGSQHG